MQLPARPRRSTKCAQHELDERVRRFDGPRRLLAIDVAERNRFDSGNQRKYGEFIRGSGDVPVRVGAGEPLKEEGGKALDDRLATDFMLRSKGPYFHEKDAREIFVGRDHRQDRVNACPNLLHGSCRRRRHCALDRLKEQPPGFRVEGQHRRWEVIEVLVKRPPTDARDVNHVLDGRL